MADPAEVIYIEPICDRCRHYAELGAWFDTEAEAGCVENDCLTKPVAYIRADLHTAKMEEIAARAAEAEDELYSRILMLQSEIDRLKAEIETPRERRGFS